MSLFIVALLYILLYVAIAVLGLLIIIWIVEQIFGVAIPPRIKQLMYVIVLIFLLIAIVKTIPFPPLLR